MVLQQQGKSTKIDYEGDFNVYLKFLITGQSENKLSVRNIFKLWNNNFFSSTAGSSHMMAFAPAHVIDEAFATLANDLEETNDCHSYNDNSGGSDSGLVGDPPVQLTVVPAKGQGKGRGRVRK